LNISNNILRFDLLIPIPVSLIYTLISFNNSFKHVLTYIDPLQVYFIAF